MLESHGVIPASLYSAFFIKIPFNVNLWYCINALDEISDGQELAAW